MTECRLCPLPLDYAATANGLDVCTTCALQALRASRRGTRAVVVSRVEVAPTDEWATFTAAVRSVAAEHNGEVDWTFVRPLLRNRIEPKHVGQLVRRARSRGLLVEVAHHRSEDRVGKNAGRLEPLYRLGEAA